MNAPIQISSIPLVSPLSWRGRSPLHHKLGPRAIRYIWPAGLGLPLTNSPVNLNFRFDASSAIDRIVGFILSIQSCVASADFILQDLSTGWFFDYTYPGQTGAYIINNAVTAVDECNLQFAFSAQLTGDVFLQLMNIELMPYG